MSVWIVSTILVVALYLLITEKIPVDLTAIGIIVVLMVSRVLSPLEAVAGYRFSDYLKLGIPLNFIVLILGTLLIPILWPL